MKRIIITVLIAFTAINVQARKDRNVYYNCDNPEMISKIVKDVSNIKVTLNQMAKLSSMMPTK